MPESPQPLIVFISYSHNSAEHKNEVLNLADRLRHDGIDCRLDQYETSPPEGWPRWAEKEIRDAQYVLMICTESYYRRVMGEEKPDIGHGVRWEGHVIYQHLYNTGTVNQKFVPVVLAPGDEKHTPAPLQGFQHYHIYTEQGYEDLYRRLTDQPGTLKPKLGDLRSLPTKKRQAEFGGTPPSPDKPTAIKGLRAFRRSDQLVFARLQRESALAGCLAAIIDSEFRFGILSGESGCGKSSFLQAGLLPSLEQVCQPHTGVYVKISNEDPIQSLRTAMVRDLGLQQEEFQDADFIRLLEAAASAVSNPIVVVLDQFEQFFVHRKLKQDREPFVQAMAAWYRRTNLSQVKVLVSVRGDFSDRLVELQQSMGYSIGPGQNFRLEKFVPEEAAAVMRIIAELEGLRFDAPFVERMAREELASREDGLISPVDLQVLAWVIKGQKTEDKHAFTGKAFQKIGGIEGLLERFLIDTLAARHGDASKQAVLQVLLGLIDLERNTSAGSVTVEQLQGKLEGTLGAKEIVEVVQWLAREDIRLVTSLERDETVSYELAHERLIPAVRKVAGKRLSEGNRANELLDRRLNEWLGNDRNSRFLLSWREWRLIETQKPYIAWGPKRVHKEELLRRTKQRWVRYGWEAAGLLSVIVFSFAMLLSPWGQIELVKWDIDKLIRGKDKRTGSVIALRLLSTPYPLQTAAELLKEAVDTAVSIDNPFDKAHLLGALAQAVAQGGSASKNPELLKQVVQGAGRIDDPDQKAEALRVVAEGLARGASASKNIELLKQATEMAVHIKSPFLKAQVLRIAAEGLVRGASTSKNPELLRHAVEVVALIDDPDLKSVAFREVAESVVQGASAGKNPELLKQASEVASRIDSPARKAYALRTVAKAMAQAGDAGKAAELLRQAVEVAGRIDDAEKKADALRAMAETVGQAGDAGKAAELLRQAVEVAGRIDDAEKKADALRAIAETVGQAGDAGKAAELLRQAVEVADRIDDPSRKTYALLRVAETVAQRGDAGKVAQLLRMAMKETGRIDDPSQKAIALKNVTYGLAHGASPSKNPELLEQAVEVVALIDDPFQTGDALKEVARRVAQRGDVGRNPELLKQVVEIAARIDDPKVKAFALGNVAAGLARGASASKNLKLLKQAEDVVAQIDIPKMKALALRWVAEEVAKEASAGKNPELLKQAADIAARIYEHDQKAGALREVAKTAAQLGYWRQARDYAVQNVTDEGRVEALIAILKVWYGTEEEDTDFITL